MIDPLLKSKANGNYKAAPSTIRHCPISSPFPFLRTNFFFIFLPEISILARVYQSLSRLGATLIAVPPLPIHSRGRRAELFLLCPQLLQDLFFRRLQLRCAGTAESSGLGSELRIFVGTRLRHVLGSMCLLTYLFVDWVALPSMKDQEQESFRVLGSFQVGDREFDLTAESLPRLWI